VINNCLSQIYFRPFSYKTARELEQWLGYTSGFAQSKSTYGEHATSEGLSEREVPLLSADQVRLIDEDEVLGFLPGIRPFLARRMNWHRFPVLEKRSAIAPPPLPLLPALPDPLPVVTATATATTTAEESEPDPPEESLDSWQPDPALFRRRGVFPSANGFRKKRIAQQMSRGE
jgi:type IV secretory pathway TraG/TraD family ATPase VirD4